jgi:hypothetical protein
MAQEKKKEDKFPLIGKKSSKFVPRFNRFWKELVSKTKADALYDGMPSPLAYHCPPSPSNLQPAAVTGSLFESLIEWLTDLSAYALHCARHPSAPLHLKLPLYSAPSS